MNEMLVPYSVTKIVFLSVVSLLFAQAGLGREYIVNQGASEASDNNSGTANKPLRTISAAAEKVHAGDKVIIFSGEYRETVSVNASGTVDAPIVFEAAPNAQPVIKGSELVKDWVLEAGNTWKARLPPISNRSKSAGESSSWRTNDVRQVFVKDGELLDALHLRRVAAKDQLRPGTFFCDVANSFIFVLLSGSSNPNHHEMEVSVRGAWMYINGSNIMVRGLRMRHSSTLAIANWPACNLHGNNITMENCQLTWGDFIGVNLGGAHNTLRSCTIACHGNSGINGSGEGHTIDKCRVLYNNIDRYDPGWHCGGAKLIPNFNRGRITHNQFVGNIGPGLWLDGSCNENVIDGNLCYENEGPGIMIEISSGNGVFNNICFGNRNPLPAEFLQPDPEAVKRKEYNKFVAFQYKGEARFKQLPYHAGDGRGIYISSSPETKVYHNTCYLNEGEGICVEGKLRQTGTGTAMATRNCTVLNNISVYNKGTQLVLRRNGVDEATHDNRSDYNLLLALGAVFARGGWDATIASSLHDWQKQTSQDDHSIEAEPFFAMAAMGDFRLLPISPAANAGLPLEQVHHDFFGDVRSQNSVSIGACESPALDYPRPPMMYRGTPENP